VGGPVGDRGYAPGTGSTYERVLGAGPGLDRLATRALRDGSDGKPKHRTRPDLAAAAEGWRVARGLPAGRGRFALKSITRPGCRHTEWRLTHMRITICA